MPIDGWQRIFINVFGGVVLILLTLVLANMNDRYRASEAQRDFKKLRLEIVLVETRMKERITAHQVSGPHDKVAERLAVAENNYQLVLEELRALRSDILDK